MELLGAKEVSDMTGIPVGTLRYWRHSNIGPASFMNRPGNGGGSEPPPEAGRFTTPMSRNWAFPRSFNTRPSPPAAHRSPLSSRRSAGRWTAESPNAASTR